MNLLNTSIKILELNTTLEVIWEILMFGIWIINCNWANIVDLTLIGYWRFFQKKEDKKILTKSNFFFLSLN